MTEHKVCKGCRWNKYPECEGTFIMGVLMKIDNLNVGFQCGQKDRESSYELISIPEKTKVELLELRVEELESKVQILEEVKVDG